MRRLILFLFACILITGCSQNNKSFVWERIDSTVNVRADGTLGVSETLKLRYSGGPFTFAFRDLPDRRLDGMNNIRVEDASGAYQQVNDAESTTPRTFSISENDGQQRVRWVYPAASDTTQTFVLRYDVAGAVRRYADHDEVWWSMVFPNRDEVVEQARGVIQLPSAVPTDQLTASTPDLAGSVELVAGAANVQAANIATNQELSLRLRFPKNSVGGTAPNWQAGQDAQDAYNLTTRPTVNVALSLLAALILAGMSGWAWLWYRGNRDPQVASVGQSYDPPSNLAPAEAAALLGSASAQGVLGTLFDLANRGFLRFEERANRWNGRTLHAIRQPQPQTALAPYEQQALDALFSKGDDVAMDGTNTGMAQVAPKIGKVIEAELRSRGIYDPAARARRGHMQTISLVLLFVGIALAVAGLLFAERYSFWLPAVGAALTLGSCAWLIASSAIQGLTAAGADLFARWKAFQRFLTAKEQTGARPGQFDQLLPYAVAIGNAQHFTGRYNATAEPLPVWYMPIIASSDPGHSTGGTGTPLLLQDFSQNFLSSLSSATSASGDGGGGGGGGSSGGGGGGAG